MADDEREFGPIGTKLLFENDRVRIWEVRLAPGERGALHRHELDHVLVQIHGDRVAVESEPDSPTPWGPYFEAPIAPGDFSCDAPRRGRDGGQRGHARFPRDHRRAQGLSVAGFLVGDIFRNAARAVPDRVAVVLGDESLTFGRLDRLANGAVRVLSRTRPVVGRPCGRLERNQSRRRRGFRGVGQGGSRVRAGEPCVGCRGSRTDRRRGPPGGDRRRRGASGPRARARRRIEFRSSRCGRGRRRESVSTSRVDLDDTDLTSSSSRVGVPAVRRARCCRIGSTCCGPIPARSSNRVAPPSACSRCSTWRGGRSRCSSGRRGRR